MSNVIDGTAKFSCAHEFVAMPNGFRCAGCNHFRSELSIDTRKALIFFPIPEPVAKNQTVTAIAAGI